MKVQYRQREHSFGPHAQLLFQGSNEAAQELISWCEGNLIPHTWDYQVWDIGQQTYLQVDSIDPGTIMLFKLTYG